jgi:hypothetical protein
MDGTSARLSKTIKLMIAEADALEVQRARLNPSVEADRERFHLLDQKAQILRDQIRELGVELSLLIDAELEKSIPLPTKFERARKS